MLYDEIQEAVKYIQQINDFEPTYGIILGTGLGALSDEIERVAEIDYKDIPYFPISTVQTHKGKLILGHLYGHKVVAMAGRFHYYEGYSMKEITFPIRVMKRLGVKALLISNAAGAVNLAYKKSSLMLITDHINLYPDNPLIGENWDDFGSRFPDMSEPYSNQLNQHIKKIATDKEILLNEGVYVSVTGPNLETRAEYKMIRLIGGDAVGMSTVPEVIVANHMRLPCCAISVLTDECDPANLEPVDIADILAAAAIAEPNLSSIYKGLIAQI